MKENVHITWNLLSIVKVHFVAGRSADHGPIEKDITNAADRPWQKIQGKPITPSSHFFPGRSGNIISSDVKSEYI